MPEKEVIDPKQAAVVVSGKPSPPEVAPQKPQTPQPTKRLYRFVKLQVPGEVVKLRDGTEISFRIPKTQHNGFSPVGYFETSDVAVAKELVEIGSDHYIVPKE
jgi:hypothetical protein